MGERQLDKLEVTGSSPVTPIDRGTCTGTNRRANPLSVRHVSCGCVAGRGDLGRRSDAAFPSCDEPRRGDLVGVDLVDAVFRQSQATGRPRLVLPAHAHSASHEKSIRYRQAEAWPSQARLAEMCGMDREGPAAPTLRAPGTTADKGRGNGWDASKFRRAGVARANGRCPRCGRRAKLEAHHIDPIRNGGDPADVGRSVAICSRCHRRSEGEAARGA